MVKTLPSGSEENIERLKKICWTTYRMIWDEYYDWDASDSRRIIEGFAGQPPRTTPCYSIDSCETLQELSAPPNSGALEEFVAFCHFEDAPSIQATMKVYHAPDVAEDDIFVESPRYEMCSTIQQNILLGDEPDTAPFLPYADDRDFDHEEYLKDFSSLSWEMTYDPSQSWIIVEIVRRLLAEYKTISLADVDDCQIFPARLLSTPTEWGLIHRTNQTIPPPWPGFGTTPLPDSLTPPESDDWRQRVQTNLSIFCSNTNCVQSHCWTHGNENHDFERDDRYIVPLSCEFPEIPSEPCGTECYILNRSHNGQAQKCSSRQIENWRLLFTISPEATACDIAAVAGDVPCWEVYSQRAIFLRDLPQPSQKYSPSPSPSAASGPSSKRIKARDEKQFEPCSHEGPCSASNEACHCATNGTSCERPCCCSPDCSRRWKGCRCSIQRSKSTALCHKGRCPCVSNGRECDPERCLCCKDQQSDTACKNADLLRGLTKNLAVKPAAHGFGVFAEESIAEGDFICEYTGELIYPTTSETRDFIADHRGRAYIYVLNSTFHVDASYAGSIPRFINHRPNDQANCVARFRIVCGDHRIGIYAKAPIPEGVELTIDYGKFFFSDKPQ